MPMLASFVILLISSIIVHPRNNAMPMPADEGGNFSRVQNNLPPESICESCLEPSRKEDKASSASELFTDLIMISTKVCHASPSDFKAKCLETSDAFVHRTRLILTEISNEESLCNRTGLCLLKSTLSTTNGIVPLTQNPAEEEEEKTCNACHIFLKGIFVHLNQPKMRMTVMEALTAYCEEMEDNASTCKQIMHKHVLLFLLKLEKLKANEFCLSMGFCGGLDSEKLSNDL